MSLRNYAIAWREDSGAPYVGTLELAPFVLRLAGHSRRGEVLRSIPYEDVLDVTTERPNGHRTLRLTVRGCSPVEIDSLDSPGSLTELLHELRKCRP